jgi:hypothetical protein
MADPFGIAQALATFFNMTVDMAGFILGMVFTVGLLLTFEFLIGAQASGGASADAGQILFASLTLGIIASVLVGWFPAWVVIFAALFGAIILVNPFGG